MAEKIEQRSVSVRIDGKEVESSLKNIAKEAAALRTEMQNLAEANEDYVAKAIRIAELKEVTDAHRKEVAEIGKAWQKMPDDVKKAVSQSQKELADLNKMVSDMRKIDPDSGIITQLQNEQKKIRLGIQETVNAYMHLEQAAEHSLESIQKEYEELYKDVQKATIGTEEYYRKAAKLRDLDTQIKTHTEGLHHVEQAWHKNIPAIKGFAAAAISALAIDSIMAYGAALQENAVKMDTNLRKAASVLAEHLGRINHEAERHAQTFGIARSEYVGAAADMSAFFQSQFASREEGAKLASQTVQLAGVLAGFKGGGAEQFQEALEAIKGGFSDNVEELAKFNIALSDDTIKAAMAERGLDKLNAKQQEHAKGLVLLQLIQEKATAQTAAFGDMQGSLARQSASMHAQLKEIGDTLSRILIPIFNKMLSVVGPVVAAFGKIADGIEKISNPTRMASEAFFAQSEKVKELDKSVNPLLKTYDRLTEKSEKVGGAAKLNKKEQAELKKTIVELGEAVPEAKMGLDDYGKALSINRGEVTKFVTEQKLMLKYLNEVAIEKETADIQEMEAHHKALKRSAEMAHAGKLAKTTWAWGVGQYARKYTEAELSELDGSVGALMERLEGARIHLKRLNGESIKLPEAPKPPDLSGASEEDRKKAEDLVKTRKSNMEKLREAEKAHRSDLLAQNMRDDERDAERIREKYRKDIELAKEMEKVKGKMGEEAKKIRLALEDMEAKEIAAKKLENHEKIINELKKISEKYAVNQGDLALDDLGKKLKSIKEKFADEFAKIKKSEASDDEGIKAQAKVTRLDVEKAMNAEMEAERDRHVLEMAKKAEELWQKTQIATTEGADKEIWETIFHYQALMDLQIGHDDETRKLAEAQARAIGEINKKYREKDLKDAAEKHKQELRFDKALAEAQKKLTDEKLGAMKDYGTFLGAVLGESAKKNLVYFALVKGLAIAEILINASREASAIKAAFAIQAASFAAVPGAAAGFIATGATLSALAIIRGGFQAATVGALAIHEWKANQKMEGGWSNVVGAQDGKTYRAQYKGQATTGPVLNPSVFLAGEQPEYVIAYPEMQNPMVANFVGAIEGIRQRRINNYSDGGQVETPTSRKAQSISYTQQAASATTEGSVNMPLHVFNMMMETMQATRDAMQRGILIRYEDADHIDKMIQNVNENRGYARR